MLYFKIAYIEDMFGKQLRKFFAAATAIFWVDKSKFLMSVFACFWAVQHIACAYGTDESSEDDYYDSEWNCTPIFDVSKISREGYDACENTLADLVEYMEACKNPHDSVPMVSGPAGSGLMESAFVDGKPVDCSYDTQNSSMALIDDYTLTCSTTHMKAEAAFTGYQCGLYYVSVEEGNLRKREKNDWSQRHMQQ